MITVLFSCSACGLVDAEAKVPARERDDDLLWWTQRIMMPAVARQHLLRSLLCEATSLQNVKIPIPTEGEDVWIGKQTDVVPPGGGKK